MAWACQRNSYLKELVCRVVSCVSVREGCYEVVLNDTVLFPEGGGQPHDTGYIGEAKVTQVLRKGADAVHITAQELTVGEEYPCTIDWSRRFDHMQQHSAQHLLSALLDNLYKLKTLSWEMGRSVSHVELNTPQVSEEQMAVIEEQCNACIREHRTVDVHYLTKDEASLLEEVQSRGLPADAPEPVRVIEMSEVDKNMCCGTHVNNLSELQAIKLLHTETMRGNTRIFFVAGNRVLEKFSTCYNIERKLNKLLSCGADEHVDSVEKLKNNLRLAQKSSRTYLKEIGAHEGKDLVQMYKNEGYVFHHREDGDMDYIFAILNTLPSDIYAKSVVFVCGGGVKTGGQFVLRGPEEKVKGLSAPVLELIQGKGGGKKGQLQGKAMSYQKLDEVCELIKQSCLELPVER